MRVLHVYVCRLIVCIISCFLISSLLILPATRATLANTSTVRISEVHAQPETGQPEWVEMHNTSSQSIDISGWTLEDTLSAPSVIFTFPAQSMLVPDQYFVIELAGSKLNNSADGVVLKNSAGDIIDQMLYTSSDKSATWQYSGTDWCKASPSPGSANVCPAPASPTPTATPIPTADPLATPTATQSSTTPIVSSSNPPASPTPTPSPTPEPAHNVYLPLQVTEISPCPQDSKEWVEFFNPNTTDAIVENYLLTDAQSNRRFLNGEIKAGGYGILYVSSSILNNAGDTIKVVDENNRALANLSYDSCSGVVTLSLFANGWSWGEPSPGKENVRLSSSNLTSTSSSSSSVLVPISHVERSQSSIEESGTSSTQAFSPPSTTINTGSADKQQKYRPTTLASSLLLPNRLTASSSARSVLGVSIGSANTPSPPIYSLASTQLRHRLPATLVIMGGSVLVLASSSIYVSITSDLRRLAQRLASARALGKFNFLSQLPVGAAQR